jgi:hypothetical protein
MGDLRGDVLLVGSLPFDSVEEAFRAVGDGLGEHAVGFPDGEIGPRKNWVGFLVTDVYPLHPQLEATAPAPSGPLRQPRDRDERDRGRARATGQFRVKPGADLRFDDLRYGSLAVDSYGVFRRLRDEGTLPSSARFQVALPAPNSAVNAFFSDPAQWPQVHHAYVDGLAGEMAKMLQVIPAEDLLVQFDLAFEVIDLSMGEDNYFPFWPDSTREEKFERHTASLGDLAAIVPAGALLGYHWCYGTWGGWPMTAMADLSLCVELSNEAVRRSARPVDYVHMPVVRHPDAAFFAPLADLDVGSTAVFLGLVHHTDGIEGFRDRVALARPVLPAFGVSSVCGYGRIDPAELPEVLRVHRDCAVELETG